MAVSRNDVTFRSREFVFTPVDAAAYSDLLADAFPDFRYFDAPPHAGQDAPQPEIVLRPTLKACDRRGTVELVSDPYWSPSWRREERYGWWVLGELPFPYAQIFCYCPIYRGDKLASKLPPETAAVDGPEHIGAFMGEGYASFVCRKDNKRDLTIAGKALRLLRKVATNKLQTVCYPSMETIARCEKGSIVWLGQDAIRWCREDPNRMLNYDERTKIGCRPLD